MYPYKASRTCCQGLVASGFLIITFLFLDHDLTQSGMRRFSDQSPPPITLPALATANLIFFLSTKYDLKELRIINTADALEEL